MFFPLFVSNIHFFSSNLNIWFAVPFVLLQLVSHVQNTKHFFCLYNLGLGLTVSSHQWIQLNFFFSSNFCILLTVPLSISLDNDQLDAHLLYFTVRPLQSSTCFEHYMLIIRRLNCSAVLSQPVHRTATDWEDDTRCSINTIQPPDDEHVMLETCRGL